MKNEIDAFISYMREQKQISDNTAAAYTRDLCKLAAYVCGMGVDDFVQVDTGILQAYLHGLETQGRKAATISRVIASMKAFFAWQLGEGLRTDDPAKGLKPPKIEKKPPEILTQAQIVKLLDQPSSGAPKELRDKAMMELLYATGIRVSELLSLRLQDVNLKLEYVTCRDGRKERTVPFGSTAREALEVYLEAVEALRQAGGTYRGDHTAYAQAFVCGASVEQRCGSQVCAGIDGAFGYFIDTDIYAVIRPHDP